MSYTYHGVELVNCSPPRKRKGPLEKFTFGQYVGQRVEDVIRRNPRYIMWAAKEFLDLSPTQAFLFETVTGGGIIPDAYISSREPKRMVISPLPEVRKPVSPPRPVESPSIKDTTKLPDPIPEWEGVDCTWPNLGFDPDLAPRWWTRFQEHIREKGLTGKQAKWLYEFYVKRDMDAMRKVYEYEYRNSHST